MQEPSESVDLCQGWAVPHRKAVSPSKKFLDPGLDLDPCQNLITCYLGQLFMQMCVQNKHSKKSVSVYLYIYNLNGWENKSDHFNLNINAHLRAGKII